MEEDQKESAPGTHSLGGADTAAALVAAWSGTAQPSREVSAQVSRHVASLLGQDIAADDVREGLRAMEAKALGAHLLPSLVHEARARKRGQQEQQDLATAQYGTESPAPEPTWGDA